VPRRKYREGDSLQKVLGVPALFSTAYGNVGSSIYYALGLVALWALGVTPLVFLLTGLLFCTTAWSYAEATAMVPEAGGSSSFGRRAFNEFVSFGAGWALMLDYIVTVAISAYFVPNYLSVFWPVLKTFPYNSIGGIVTILALVAINVIGIKEAARLNIILALLDLGTQILLMVVGVVLLLEPKLLIDQVHLGVAPTWSHLIYGLSIGTIAYTGIETISNMSEEAANPDRDVPRAVNFVLLAVLIVYLGISMTALSAMPVKPNVLAVDPATGRSCRRARTSPTVRSCSRARPRRATRAWTCTSRRRRWASSGSSRRRRPAGRRTPKTASSTRSCTAPSSAACTRKTRWSASCASCRATWAGSRRSSCRGSASWRRPSC
jgi:amino acid transporter